MRARNKITICKQHRINTARHNAREFAAELIYRRLSYVIHRENGQPLDQTKRKSKKR